MIKVLSRIKRFTLNNFNLIFKRSNSKFDNYHNLVILSHEGLGDHIAIFNAICQLSLKHNIYICCRKEIYDQINFILNWPKNVKLIRFIDINHSYRITRARKKLFKRYGLFIPLGHYGYSKINDYPNSFYNQLNISSIYSEKKIPIKDYINDFFIENNCESDYIYINTYFNLNESLNIAKNYKYPSFIYINPTKIIFIKNNLLTTINTCNTKSLYNNYLLAKNAKIIITSDGGFYNLLIRTLNNFDMYIYTRIHKPSHNKKIYAQNFDGQIHHLTRINNIDKLIF